MSTRTSSLSIRTTRAGDDVALLEGGEGRVVVRDDLAVDLEEQAVGAFDDLRVRSRDGGLGHVAA